MHKAVESVKSVKNDQSDASKNFAFVSVLRHQIENFFLIHRRRIGSDIGHFP